MADTEELSERLETEARIRESSGSNPNDGASDPSSGPISVDTPDVSTIPLPNDALISQSVSSTNAPEGSIPTNDVEMGAHPIKEETGSQGDCPNRPIPKFPPSTETHPGEDDVLEPESDCEQCSSQDLSLGDRHFYTHVRIVHSYSHEYTSDFDANFPKVLDHFSLVNHDSSYDREFLYEDESDTPIPLPKHHSKPFYHNAPRFLRHIVESSVRRLESNHLIKTLRSSRELKVYIHPRQVEYVDINNKRIIRTSDSWDYAAPLVKQDPPKHECITLENGKTHWFDSIFYVWVFLRIEKISMSRHILSKPESELLDTLRDRIMEETDPLMVMSGLLAAYDRYRTRTLSTIRWLGMMSSTPIGCDTQTGPSVKTTTHTHTTTDTHTDTPHGSLNACFNDLPSTSRDGSRKQRSTPVEGSWEKSQRTKIQAENILKRRNADGTKTTSCRRRLIFADSPVATTATPEGSNWLRTSSTPCLKMVLTTSTNQHPSGLHTTPPNSANSNLVPLGPRKGSQPTKPSPHRPSERRDQTAVLSSANGCSNAPSNTLPATSLGPNSAVLPTPKQPIKEETEELMFTIDTMGTHAHEEFDKKQARALKRRLKQQKRRQLKRQQALKSDQ